MVDPLSLALGAVGLGMQIFGGFGQASAAHQQAEISQQEAAVSKDVAVQEQGINDQKQMAMEMDARRQQLQIMRTNQQTMALAQARATNQGAAFGSGLQGGLAGVMDQSLTNLFGVTNALTTGRNIAGYNKNITADRFKSADLQSQSAAVGGTAATDQGISSLGGAILKEGPTIGNLFKGGGTSFASLFGGGSPSGYGTA
jgi:hypothetical protein